MNQKILLTLVAVFLSVLGSPLEGRTQTNKDKTSIHQKSAVADVLKQGETQTRKQNNSLDTDNTQIYAHSLEGRQAATLYIRNIPVLTFLDSQSVSRTKTRIGTISSVKATNSKIGEPIRKASVLATKINHLIKENADASKITVSWQGKASAVNNKAENKDSAVKKQLESYSIKINDEELV